MRCKRTRSRHAAVWPESGGGDGSFKERRGKGWNPPRFVLPGHTAAWRLRAMHYDTLSLVHGFYPLDGATSHNGPSCFRTIAQHSLLRRAIPQHAMLWFS